MGQINVGCCDKEERSKKMYFDPEIDQNIQALLIRREMIQKVAEQNKMAMLRSTETPSQDCSDNSVYSPTKINRAKQKIKREQKLGADLCLSEVNYQKVPKNLKEEKKVPKKNPKKDKIRHSFDDRK